MTRAARVSLPVVFAAGLGALGLVVAGCSSSTATAESATGVRAAVVASDGAAPAAAGGSLSPRVQRTIATGLTTPWGLAFLPDGSALVSERDTGVIVKVTPTGRVSRVGTVAGSVHAAAGGGEGGLLGLALDPGWPRQPWVYAYTTTATDNRIVRMRWTGAALGPMQVLVKGIEKSAHHNGGRLGFGPDGMLYAGTGDAEQRPNAQDRSSLNGKILRMTRTGSVPADNPFAGSLVYTLGHRNVQGFGWDAKGRMWADEFGQNTWDEVNRIVAGKNYGWPLVEGIGHRRGFLDPVVVWHTDAASPSGLAIVGETAYVAALKGQRLWAVPLGGGTPRASLVSTYGRLRTVAAAPDGSLWLMSSNTDGRATPRRGDDRILRLTVR